MKKPIPFGKYYLLERINVGGMAEVFRAKAFGVEGFERMVAVKRILPNIAEDKDFIRMFVDEAKIAVQLNHANIAQIFDLGVVEGAYYIALEHVFGRDLRSIFDRCRQVGAPMPIAQACFVVMKVCEGLDYAHNKRDQAGRELNLVHRDVSPQNVLVSFEGEVKLIDFGIAKAAGQGQKTQAGILKGKFGYMSPEQVRGLPIDRRSDVFSCGIVLYELLTGERLFVGESDFSTLEKVRNVEILPPSTYNRRIPDELERIVLKALAKDVDDRYQNAIDLHDELQAFVYTAGEFYSRKDLAGWMKNTFTREIEEETAKLEQFRQLSPPDAPPARGAAAVAAGAQRRSTLNMASVAAPPPIPSSNGHPRPGPMAAAGNGAAMSAAAEHLEWDEDELETSIYDGDGSASSLAPGAALEPATSEAPTLGGMPPSPQMQGPASFSGPGALEQAPQALPPGPGQEPDLSSLARTVRGVGGEARPPVAEGSPPSPTPGPSSVPGGAFGAQPFSTGGATADGEHEPSALARLAQVGPGAEPIYDSVEPAFAPPPTKSNAGIIAAIAAVVLLLGGGGVAIFFIAKQGQESQASASVAESSSESGEEEEVETEGEAKKAVVDPDTGFDLIVDPAGVKVKLDGKSIGEAPLQIRNLAPGEHFVEIEAPAGFFNKTHNVKVVRGAAERVVIELDAMEITGRFTSEPPGSRVTLVADGEPIKVGRTPTTAKLDPRKRYEVVFKKDGYVTVTRPVEITGDQEVPVAVVLERARTVASDQSEESEGREDKARERERRERERRERERREEDERARERERERRAERERERQQEAASGGGQDSGDRASKEPGTLMIGAKPPCQIFIDGRNTGKTTPQRDLQLAAGRHRITLVNNEFGIKESFSVRIRSGETTRAIKDMSGQIK